MLTGTGSSPDCGRWGHPRGPGLLLQPFTPPTPCSPPALGQQETPSWFRAAHPAGCSEGRGGAGGQGAHAVPAAGLPADRPATPATPTRAGWEPAPVSRSQRPGVPSPFPKHSPSAIYITLGAPSSQRSRSLLRGQKPPKERKGNNSGRRGPAWFRGRSSRDVPAPPGTPHQAQRRSAHPRASWKPCSPPTRGSPCSSPPLGAVAFRAAAGARLRCWFGSWDEGVPKFPGQAGGSLPSSVIPRGHGLVWLTNPQHRAARQPSTRC